VTALWLVLAALALLLPRRVPVGGRAEPNGVSPLAVSRGGIAPPDDVTPRGGRPVSRSPVGRSPSGRSRPSLPLLSAGLAAVACLSLFGLRAGTFAAVVVAPVAGLAVRAAGRHAPPMRIGRSVALTLDLAAAGLRSGRPVGEALAAAAPAAAPEVARALLGVAGLLRLGAEPGPAWGAIASGPLAPVAATAIRSAESGIRLATAFERLAAEIRAEVAAQAAVRAHRAGVTSMAPLAACFLPSFVCLGIVPVVVGIARSALGVIA
jgi:Flp pilus assembly protein TadB